LSILEGSLLSPPSVLLFSHFSYDCPPHIYINTKGLFESRFFSNLDLGMFFALLLRSTHTQVVRSVFFRKGLIKVLLWSSPSVYMSSPARKFRRPSESFGTLAKGACLFSYFPLLFSKCCLDVGSRFSPLCIYMDFCLRKVLQSYSPEVSSFVFR